MWAKNRPNTPSTIWYKAHSKELCPSYILDEINKYNILCIFSPQASEPLSPRHAKYNSMMGNQFPGINARDPLLATYTSILNYYKYF